MAAKNLINVFVKLFVEVTPKSGDTFWTEKENMKTRVPDTFSDVPAISEALELLADSSYVNLDLVKGNGDLDAIIDAAWNAKKATRSAVTEAGLEALIHKLSSLRSYAAKVARNNGGVNVELVAYPRS